MSWLLLAGACRTCTQPISYLYPCIEIITAIFLLLLYFSVAPHYFFAYFIFFSALIVTIRSDIETMLILRYATIYLVPLGFIFSAYKLLPLSLIASITGALFGYLFLFTINTLFKFIRKKDGIGDGDYDLLLCIGSFTGITGCWTSITIGSILGSLYGLCFIIYSNYYHKKNCSLSNEKIPFGPFLALGAIIFVLYEDILFNIFSCIKHT